MNFTVNSRNILILLVLLCFLVGVYVGATFFPKTIEVIREKEEVKGSATTTTQTQVAYVTKERVVIRYIDSTTGEEKTATELEKTDLQADIGKQDFNVLVNGKEATFHKEETEKFVFEKNKVLLTQSTKIVFDVKVPKIDNTKRWGLGIGAGKNGIAGTIDFPISKSNTLGGWVAGDKENIMGGIKIKF